MKLKRPLATFDLETTGVNIATDRIVEITAKVQYPSGEINKIGPTLINPGMPIPAEVTEIHGITDEMVKDCPRFGEVAEEIARQLDGCDLAGYNLERFDIPLIIEEFLRCDIDFPNPDIKVYDAFQVMIKDTPRNLEAAHKLYVSDEKLENIHSSYQDVLATERVIEAQMKKHGIGVDDYLDFIGRQSSAYKFTREFSINDNGVVILNIGKNTRDKPALDDRGFLKWMLNQDFPLNTKKVVDELLNGTSPDDTSGPTNNEDDLPF